MIARERFEMVAARELEAANAKADRDDERMAAASRGEPFYTNKATGPAVGLAEFLPPKRDKHGHFPGCRTHGCEATRCRWPT